MRANAWMRKWRDAHSVDEHASALAHAAARGDSLDQLLDLGVKALLEAAAGDRAGLWLAADRRGESGRGRVVEAAPGPIPEQWKHLDISTPFLRDALESPEPLHVKFGPGQPTPPLGPLVGMHSATWIPLRSPNCTFGLAMVAHARAGANPHLDAVRARGDEITLAVRHYRDTRRNDLAAEELRAQLRLSRAILCGVSADSILPQIARAARHYVQAEFIALGGAGGLPVSAEGWDGHDEWRAWLQQEPLLQLWRKALEEGRESDIMGEAIPVAMGWGPESSRPVLDRLIAIPVEVRNRTAGVLMAGLLRSEDGNEDFARLESYALLAASAMDRELARQERAAGKRSLRQILEDSRECLVVVDEKGIVREASRAAAALLSPPGDIRRKCCSMIIFLPPRAKRSRNGAIDSLRRIRRWHSGRSARWFHSKPRCVPAPSSVSIFVRRLMDLAMGRCGCFISRIKMNSRPYAKRKGAWRRKWLACWIRSNPGYCSSIPPEASAW
jgi:PAS domain-containing protein